MTPHAHTAAPNDHYRLDPVKCKREHALVFGSIFGSVNPRRDVPRRLRLYQDGKLKLDEINQGYQDMRDGKNIRGMVMYSDT